MQIDSFSALQNLEKAKYDISKNVDNNKLKEQTDKFEAFLLKKILDISMPKENKLFPKDAGDKIYKSMYNDAISLSISGKFGFSELLYNFLQENNK